jgi:hypothetical protein
MENSTFDENALIIQNLQKFKHSMQMTMEVLQKLGQEASPQFHECYARLVSVDGILGEFEYLLKADTAQPLDEVEEIQSDRNTARNAYMINRWILGLETESPLMKALAQA